MSERASEMKPILSFRREWSFLSDTERCVPRFITSPIFETVYAAHTRIRAARRFRVRLRNAGESELARPLSLIQRCALACSQPLRIVLARLSFHNFRVFSSRHLGTPNMCAISRCSRGSFTAIQL